MSWQCPICETVNQDVTPVCTVCDHIAPVIESYISLEAIELLGVYNEKLDSIHSFEAIGNYEAMLDTAMEAIALYKENGLALDKAKHALIHLNNAKLKTHILALLNTAMDKENYLAASELFKLMDSFSIDTLDVADIRSEVQGHLLRKNEIAKILDESFKAIIELDTSRAMQLVEDGLSKYSASNLLQLRRDDIKKLVSALNSIKKTEGKRKPYLSPLHTEPGSGPGTTGIKADPDIINLKSGKPKYPKVNRR